MRLLVRCLAIVSMLLSLAALAQVRADGLALSADERAWLAEHPIIRMGIDAAYGPYTFVDESGQLRGVAADFMREMEASLGIRFEYVVDLAWPELMAAVRERRLDVVATVTHLPERDAFLSFTAPYLITPLVVVTRDDTAQLHSLGDLASLRLVLVEGYASTRKVMKEYPMLRPAMVATPLDGLRAVAGRSADAYVGVIGVNVFLAAQNGITNLKVNAAFDMEENSQRFGVRKDWPQLAQLLDKAFAAIPAERRNAIFQRWLPLQVDEIVRLGRPSLISRLFPWLLGALALASVGYLLVLFWNRQLRRELNRRQLQLADSDARLRAERLQQASELERSYGMLGALVEGSSDAIFVKDEQGRYVVANRALGDLLGKAQRELLGADDFAFFPQAVAERFRADDRRIMASAKVETYEETVVVAGRSIPYFTTKGPLLVQGEVRGVFGIARDVSQLKAAQAELMRARDELEQRVDERTRQLAELNRELESFAYAVAHDLKAPLRGMDAYCHLLADEYGHRIDAGGREFIAHIARGVAQMSELIDDLLSYARMEQRDLRCAAIDVRPVVDAVLAEWQGVVDRRAAKVVIGFDRLVARADREGLTVVLRNLIDNALKFAADAQPPVIEIGGQRDGGRVQLTVADHGIGFDMRFHDRIFEIFQRLQRSESYPGTGVGLALVRKVMQRMGGRVWAESSPGRGATFFLEFSDA